MKKTVVILLIISMLSSMLVGCKSTSTGGSSGKSEVDKIIEQAEKMTLQELYKKAIEESNGKTMYGIGNSSRGATAATGFIEELKKLDASYTGTIEWSQPKNNSIFTLLNADITSSTHTYSMTLIQDGNQIQSKMLNTGNLVNFIPMEWAKANGVDTKLNGEPLTLQTLNKVFMFNSTGSKEFNNVWDFVAEGSKPMFMGADSEPVGKNFLYMLTENTYATYLKEAFDALDSAEKAYFQPVIDSVEKDVTSLGLTGSNAKYGLAWIKLWCSQYNEKTDDGPICNELVTSSAMDESGLLVYSKLRSVEESDSVSVNNIKVAAYEDNYTGFGGYGYKHYLMLSKTSPLPWTACAFIAYMVTTEDGFYAWGKDMGGYSSNPNINQDHSKDGYVDGVDTFAAKNDRGYDWWVSKDGGKLVLEDPKYCAQVSFNLSDWIDVIIGNKEAATN